MKFFLLAALAVAAVGAVPYGYEQKEDYAPKPVILSQSDVRNLDGSSSFSYTTSDDVTRQESQYLKQMGKDTVTVNEGSVEWVAPDGQKVFMYWVADENGYRPTGSHLPTPPPMPAEIAAMLPNLPKLSDAELYAAPVQAAPASAFAAPAEPDYAPAYVVPEMEASRAEAPRYYNPRYYVPEDSAVAAY